MEIIPESFEKNGFEYKILCRGAHSVILTQCLRGILLNFEVHKLRRNHRRAMPNGVIAGESERLASNEDFGTYGGSFDNINAALVKYVEIGGESPSNLDKTKLQIEESDLAEEYY